jgi:hypothetical protein
MECVLLQEWVDTYLPAVGNSFRRVLAEAFPSVLGPTERSEMPISQTTGFVAADGTAVRGAKKRKAQTRREDQQALTQLMRIGDVTAAKYRFVSQVFMTRHGIGLFDPEKENSSIDQPQHTLVGSKHKESHRGQSDETESDAEWIVSALTQEEDVGQNIIAKEVSKSTRKDDSRVTVGFEIGPRKRPKRKKPAIRDVSKITAVNEHMARRKNSGPRVSDRDSGVMGRIRAAGANSLVGRNILGAYPGDAPPPNEAADPHGLFYLAEKYGYGQWSDADDDFTPEPSCGQRRAKARGAKSKARIDVNSDKGSRKSRKKTSQTIGLAFEFGTQPSTSTTKSRSRSRISDAVTKKVRMAPGPAEPTSVRETALNAIAESASKRGKREARPSSAALDSANTLTGRSQDVKSGASTVAGAGLQHLKENLEKIQEKGDSK